MTINVNIETFKSKWYLEDINTEIYSDGIIRGIINYEDDNYIVIKIKE